MKKILLLSVLFSFGCSVNAQIFLEEDWDGAGPGITEWTLYNVDNRTPVGPDGTQGEPLSFLVQDAWNVLTLEEIRTANGNPAYNYPTAAVGMFDNIVASNSWYDPVGVANDWLVSPEITIPAGTTGITLNWAAVSLGNATFLEDYRVLLSPTGGNTVADFTTVLLDVNNELNTGNYRTQALSSALAGTTFRIAFQNDGNDQYVMFLDNITVTGTLGSDEFFAGKFATYPNPVKDVLNITASENILVSNVSITDINGRTIQNTSVSNLTEAQINVANLNSGIYFLNIDSDAGKAVKKFVKN
jgi:Secretion system C-terminal sorting domain/Cleaved Adhesin Domain